ncbi:enolase C-terminal domain-like protein [Halobacteriovorax sp. GB3]|uniref:enolase C-terminal domain-like protein n=1 Tax=Halobacteriovorax sp. GB3 TaxID=2719615 RepID=UPI00235FDC03|nr:enolase C-terminal domain-like protein [Halobacteriovorax sp. GB3]MDD0852946.1 enolase C-terminal domain-like protein [Halobacteriovorax sp. GB3]
MTHLRFKEIDSLLFKNPMTIGKKVLTEKEFLRFEFDHKDGVLMGELSSLEGLHTKGLKDLIEELGQLSKEELYQLDELSISELDVSCQLKVALQCCFLFQRKERYTNIPIQINSLHVPGFNNKELLKAKRIKVKIGRDELEKEIHDINQIIENCSKDTLLRLDANRSLSKRQLEQFWNGITKKEFIEYFEEPLSNFEELFAINDIPIALDENLEKSLREKRIPSQVTSFVVKPGLNFDLKQIKELKKSQKNIILSSAFEGPFTLACYCVFIHENEELKGQFHGLDTMSAFFIQENLFTRTTCGSIFLIP